MSVAQRMKSRRKELGLSADVIAEKIGVSRSTVFRYENGDIEKLPIEILYPLSKALHTTPEYLMGLDKKENINAIYKKLSEPRKEKVYSFAEQQLDEQNKVISIEETSFDDEYVGQTAAGLPIEGQQPIPFVGAETVSLLVNGDSMEDLFFDGDVVEYHPQPELENGEIGVFAINGGITLKKFKNNGDIRLESLNKKYQDIVIKETDDFNILGRVIL